jgi:hypothetical protein
MMEAGYDGLGNDAAELFDRTANRRIREVRAGLVVVAGIREQNPAMMCLAEHDHMVDARASY